MISQRLALRPLLTRFLVSITLLCASLAWGGWVFLHSVGDPHRFEQIATSILGSNNARSEIAKSVTDQLTNINLLTPEQQTAVRGAVADALADPRIVDNFVAAFGSAQSSALGIPDPRPSAIDVGALVAVLREHLATTQPALAASIPISTQTVELPKIKSNALADLRKAANTWTVWLALLSIASLVALMIFGDRRVVLRAYGFWAILTGAFWAIGPRLAPWIAHRSAPQADGLVKATIDAVAGPITTAATVLLISGVIAFVVRAVFFRRQSTAHNPYAVAGQTQPQQQSQYQPEQYGSYGAAVAVGGPYQSGPYQSGPYQSGPYQNPAPMPHPFVAPSASAPTGAQQQEPWGQTPAPVTSGFVAQPPPQPGWEPQPTGQVPWAATQAGYPQAWPANVPRPAPLLLRPLDLPTSRDTLSPLAEADETRHN